MSGIRTEKGTLPHTEWIDLKNNGILVECVIVKRDVRGNIHYIEVPSLDAIDKQRLAKILTSRNAKQFELWDLLHQVVLNNGINALEYFHQLVRIITPEGVIYSPRQGVIGSIKSVNTENTKKK